MTVDRKRIGQFVVRLLATFGALVLLGTLLNFAITRIDGRRGNTVLGPDNKPMPGVPVFLDRGESAIERYVTDSAGKFSASLQPWERAHVVWLICAPGGIPMVVRPEPDYRGSMTFMYTKSADSTYSSYRAFGWRGPIPRECPRGADSMGWRYPKSAGKPPGAFTLTEPDWTH